MDGTMHIKTFLTSRIEAGVVLGAILVVLLLMLGTHGAWIQNLPSVLRLTAQIGILAIGQAVLMTSGEVDLSVGSAFAFVGVAFLTLLDWGTGVALATVLSLLIAVMIGFINGYITVRFNVPSMIATLGSLFIFRGTVYVLTTGFSLSVPPDERGNLAIEWLASQTLGLSNSVYILFALMALFVYGLAHTRLGSHITAVGGEPDSALANGISPPRVKVISFMLCSLMAGIAGIVVTCQEGSVYSTSGKLLELDTIAAAVIGGCSLRGGVGSIWGAVLGVFILSSLKGGLMMMGAPTYWYISFVGAILIGFLVLSKLLNPRAASAA
jgi:ribose/xylose/arabinose/galactoside ABC-type transport system permease subunit